MRIKSQSYPEKIRRIAEELRKFRVSPEVDASADKLRMIANELEHHLKVALEKKS